VRQQDAYPTNVGSAVKTMCNTSTPLVKCNISVADCMPQNIIKINGGVECITK